MPEKNWREGLSDELKGNESLAAFEDVGALAKSFIETKAMVGSGLRFPSDEASDEDKSAFLQNVMEKAPSLMLKPNFEDEDQSNEFFETLGMPKESDAYESGTFGENKFNDERGGMLRQLAHKVHLTKKQFTALTAGMLEYDHGLVAGKETKNSEDMTNLRQEWGMTWKDRNALANKVRESFLSFIPEGSMDAQTTKALYSIGAQLGTGEGAGLGDLRNEGGDDGKITPADALAKIDDIMNNQEHPYWISAHPNHSKAINDMIELRKAADPTAGTTLPRAGFGS